MIFYRLQFIIIVVLLFFCGSVLAANYPLNIINIDEVGADNRIKYAYPGIEYKVVIAAFGGTYPFDWELLQAPAGMVIDSSTGEITWSNPSAGGTVEVKVSDAESSTDTESFTVTVTSSIDRFIFVDGTNGNSSNNGSINSPFSQLDDFWLASHPGKVVYLRSGVYKYPKNGSFDDRHMHRVRLGSNNPKAFLGYPGESVTMDSENNGAESFCWYTAYSDHYFHNLIFRDIYYYGMAVVGASDYLTVYDCTFQDTYSDDGHHNQASINYMTVGGNHNNQVLFGNTFGGHQTGAFHGIETYAVNNSVFQDNEFNAVGNAGIFIKGTSTNIAIRHNIFNGPSEVWQGGLQLFGGSGHHDIEISFNLFRNNENLFLLTNQPEPLTGIHIFRNTITTLVRFRNDDGNNNFAADAIIIKNNVIQNNLSNIGSSPGDFSIDNMSYDNILTGEYNNLVAGKSDNLIGTAGIVDENGLLTDDYEQYVGIRGWQVNSDGIEIPLPVAPQGFMHVSQ